jgi:hypothetical protein
VALTAAFALVLPATPLSAGRLPVSGGGQARLTLCAAATPAPEASANAPCAGCEAKAEKAPEKKAEGGKCAPPTPAQLCGVVAVATFAELLGHHYPESRVEEVARAQAGRPMTMLRLKEELELAGIAARGLSVDYQDLACIGRPFIAFLRVKDRGHFAVIERVTEEWARMVEGEEAGLVPAAELKKAFGGAILVQGTTRCEDPSAPGASYTLEPQIAELFASGPRREIELTITNTGGSVLEVSGVRAPGYLAVGGQWPAQVAPGGKLAFSVAPASGSWPSATSEAHVRTATNDAVQPAAYATLRLLGEQSLDVWPSSIDFGRGRPEELRSRTRVLQVLSFDEVTDASVRTGARWLKTTVGRRQAPAGGVLAPSSRRLVEVRVSFVPSVLSGADEDLRGELVISSARGGEPVRVPVTASVVGDPAAAPSDVFLGIVSGSSVPRVSQEVRISSRKRIRFNEKAIRAPRGVHALLRSVPSRRERPWRLIVWANANEVAPGATSGDIVLPFADEQKHERALRVPAYVYRLAPGAQAQSRGDGSKSKKAEKKGGSGS